METQRKPLETEADLALLLEHFYGRVRRDDLIGPIFNDVAKVNWEEHLPKIRRFWETLLFQADNYHSRPFPPHIPLGLKVEHFERWLQLFFQTTDEFFEGPKANEIKHRALNIGRNFLGNLQQLSRRDENS